MPGLRGKEPTRSAQLQSVERLVGVVGDDDVLQRREAAVVQLHRDALGDVQRLAGRREGGCSRALRDLQQLQDHLAVRPEHLAGGQPGQHGVRHLPAAPVTATRIVSP